MPTIIPQIIPFEDWKKRAGNNPYLRPIFLLDRYLKENIRNELIGFYLHGSLASLDYVQGYSDFDAVMVVKKFDNKKFGKISRFPYLVDILQHHKITMIKADELSDYDKTDFPPILFQGSVALGNSRLKLEIKAKETDYRKAFIDLHRFFKNGNFEKIEQKKALDLKAFLSVFQLFPALYLQAKLNEFIDKKSSFEEAKKDFGEEWMAMETASQIRKEWRYSPLFSERTQNLLLKTPNLERMFWFYGKFIMTCPAEIKEKLGNNFFEKSSQLIDLMANKLSINEQF